MSARASGNPDKLSPFQKLYGRAPFSRLLPFFKPGSHHVKRALKSEQKAQAFFSLSSGVNHPRDCCKVLLVSGRRSYTRDVTWERPREAFAGLLPAAWGGGTPSFASRLPEMLTAPEDEGVWYEPAPVPSRTSTGPAPPSQVASRTSPGPARPLSVPSPVQSRPSWVPSLVPMMPVPSPSQSLPPSLQQQQLVLSQQVPRKLRDYFSGAVGGGEPQQLGRTRRQAARNQEGIVDRPQTADDGVAQQLGRTRGQTARNQGGMQHGLLSFTAWREGIGYVLDHQAPSHANPPLPACPVS